MHVLPSLLVKVLNFFLLISASLRSGVADIQSCMHRLYLVHKQAPQCFGRAQVIERYILQRGP